MKNKVFAALLIMITAIVMTSCYSSRKQGCPGNPNSTAKFRG